MADARLPRSAAVRRRLSQLPQLAVNFDMSLGPNNLEGSRGPEPAAGKGWRVDDLCQRLPDEPPGPPQPRGSWEIARRLMGGYAFADPSIVRAYYDPSVPLQGRNMLLELQALRVLHLYVGVRVASVTDDVRTVDGREVRVWGWTYVTLQGHVEMGAMSWQVWKWLDTGAAEFRVHAASRPAPVRNPLVRIGFGALRGHQRRTFLESTKRRMRRFTELGLENHLSAERVRSVARAFTARPLRDDSAHDEVIRALTDRALTDGAGVAAAR